MGLEVEAEETQRFEARGEFEKLSLLQGSICQGIWAAFGI
jgi:hypothetical protein